MNTNKICFIICSSDMQYTEECISYIKDLYVPQCMEVEIQCVKDSSNMSHIYNQAMNKSDAKYKVYIQQDVFIVYRDFIQKCLDYFGKHSQVGMLGVLGKNNCIYCQNKENWNLGRIMLCDTQNAYYFDYQNGEEDRVDAAVISGILWITQYDVFWGEENLLLYNNHYIIVGDNFRRAGYGVKIIQQEGFWCLYDCGRSIYKKNELCTLKDWKERLRQAYEQEKFDEMYDITSQYNDKTVPDTELSLWKKILRIREAEIQSGVGGEFKAKSYQDIFKACNKIKFMIWRIEFGREWKHLLEAKNIVAIVQIALSNSFQFERVLCELVPLVEGEKEKKYLQQHIDMGIVIRKRQKGELDNRIINKIAIYEKEKKIYMNKQQEKCIKHVNEILSNRKKRDLLCNWLNRVDVEEVVVNSEKLSYIKKSAQIYREEREQYMTDTIWDNFHSVDEIIVCMTDIKFLLWHVEFQTQSDAIIELMEYIYKYKISWCMIKNMVNMVAFNEEKMLVKVARMYIEMKQFSSAFALLNYAEGLNPRNKEVLHMLSEIYMIANQREKALEYQQKLEIIGV